MIKSIFTCQSALLNLLASVAVCVGATGNVLAAEDHMGQQLVVVVGAGGTEEYAAEFRQWAQQWQESAKSGDVAVQVLGSGQQSDADTVADSSDSTVPSLALREQFLKTVSQAAQIDSDEPLWLVLIGHGTYDGRTARFNLPGPDLSSEQLADAVGGAKRPLAIINCSSCSAPFINALSGPGRVIVTATKSGSESQFCRFGRYMASAIFSEDADLDRDGQTSLREAWLVATSGTEMFYESDGRLATEHSLLDDNGDQAGTSVASYKDGRLRNDLKEPEKVDGKIAASWHLIRSAEEQLLTSKQRKQRAELEAKLEQLRKRKSDLSEIEYLDQLEQLLLPLAKLYQATEKSTQPQNLE